MDLTTTDIVRSVASGRNYTETQTYTLSTTVFLVEERDGWERSE